MRLADIFSFQCKMAELKKKKDKLRSRGKYWVEPLWESRQCRPMKKFEEVTLYHPKVRIYVRKENEV